MRSVDDTAAGGEGRLHRHDREEVTAMRDVVS
jgi:hypothetical protein